MKRPIGISRNRLETFQNVKSSLTRKKNMFKYNNLDSNSSENKHKYLMRDYLTMHKQPIIAITISCLQLPNTQFTAAKPWTPTSLVKFTNRLNHICNKWLNIVLFYETR